MKHYIAYYESYRKTGASDWRMIVADNIDSATTIAWDMFGQRLRIVILWADNSV